MIEFDKGEYSDKFSDFYVYISTLGSGSFGTVVHALDRSTGEEVAVKIIKKKSVKPGKISELKKEAEILSSLDHPNIVKFIHLKETQKRIFLVMELVISGNLSDFAKGNKLTDFQVSQIMSGVFRAVDYIHSKNVIHRDIKPQNILISSKKNLMLVKLADFGLSSQFEDLHDMENENCGTLWFMAPEQTGKTFYSKSVDIWSCGILMYYLISGSHPLANLRDSRSTYLKKLKNPNWNISEKLSKSAKNLFHKLVESVPIQRYTAAQALNHPWILRREVKAPLTSFEKFKIYGEILKLKSISFPLFFASIVAEQHFSVDCKTDQKEIKPVLKPNNRTQIKRGITNSTPDVSFMKRSRFLTPGKSSIMKRRVNEKVSTSKLSFVKK